MLCWKGPSCCHLNQLHGMAPLHHWERTSASKWQEALATSVPCPLQEVHLNQTTHYFPIPKAIGVMWGRRTTNIWSPPQHKSRFPSRSMHRVLGRHKRHGSLYTQETKETVNEHVNPCAHWFGFSWVVLLMSSYFVAEKSSLSVKPGTAETTGKAWSLSNHTRLHNSSRKKAFMQHSGNLSVAWWCCITLSVCRCSKTDNDCNFVRKIPIFFLETNVEV